MTLFDTTGVGVVAALDPARAVARALASRWSRRVTALTVLTLAAITVLATLRWSLAGDVVPWDSKNHFYPMFRFLGDALRHGTLPLWNPYHFGGYPAVADPQSLLFTPTMLIAALVAPNASMPVFDLIVMAHLLFGGVCVLGLARRWRWHPASACLAALVFMFGGAASARLQHTGMIVSYAFFPAALWALQAALERSSLRLAMLAGVGAALMALGRDQVAFLLCLVLAGAVGREALRAGRPLVWLRDRAAILAVAGATVLTLIAVPALLTLQFLHLSNRPGIAYGVAVEGSLDPLNLLTLLAPNVFGSLDRHVDYWGPGAATPLGNNWTDRSINYLFAGSLPIVLVLWHGIAGLRLAERGGRVFALIGLAALLYAVGRATPIFGLAFDVVPGVALYRRPADAAFVLDLALALSSGFLLQRYLEDGLPRAGGLTVARVAAAGATIVGGALLVGFALAFSNGTGHLGSALAALAPFLAAAATAIAGLVLGRAPERRRIAALALVGLTAAQLNWCNAASPLNAEPSSAYSAYNGFTPSEKRGLAALDADMALRRARGEHPRIEILGGCSDGSWQNAAMVLKLEDIAGYNPLRIADYERAVGVAENSNDPAGRTFPDTFRGWNSRLSALLGLDYLVLDRPIAQLPRPVPRPRATLLSGGGGFYVYRLDNTPVPRATFATTIRTVHSAAAIGAGDLPIFVPGREALIEAADIARLADPALARPRTEASTPPPPSRATIAATSDDAVTLDVEAAAPGVAVLHDLAYPGWEASVDGIRRPILRADLLFRGVEVPAGHHTVQFSFHPLSLANLAAAFGGRRHEDGQ